MRRHVPRKRQSSAGLSPTPHTPRLAWTPASAYQRPDAGRDSNQLGAPATRLACPLGIEGIVSKKLERALPLRNPDSPAMVRHWEASSRPIKCVGTRIGGLDTAETFPGNGAVSTDFGFAINSRKRRRAASTGMPKSSQRGFDHSASANDTVSQPPIGRSQAASMLPAKARPYAPMRNTAL
jgi:hypothetical protein